MSADDRLYLFIWGCGAMAMGWAIGMIALGEWATHDLSKRGAVVVITLIASFALLGLVLMVPYLSKGRRS